jgi:DNA end-binding protein Ku
MLYADEVNDVDELEGVPSGVDVSDRELKMARQLIETLGSDFEPERYKDEHRERVLALIERKAEGQEIVIEAPTEEPARVVDLMAALEASLEAVKDKDKSAK